MDDSESASFRADLAIALDGVPPELDDTTDDSYRLAAALLGDRFERLRFALREAGRSVVAVGSPFDEMGRLLAATGLSHSMVASIDAIERSPTVVMVGCVSSVSEPAARRIADLLASGAIIVTSDRSAGLPTIADLLRPGAPQPPRHRPLDMNRSVWDAATDDGTDEPFGSIRPAVRLSPGFRQIDPDFGRDPDAWVLASDPATGAPLAVLMHGDGGQVLHSVAHWWQADQISGPSFDHMTVGAVPGLRHLVVPASAVTFGQLRAAWGMLRVLVAGLSLALALPGSGAIGDVKGLGE